MLWFSQPDGGFKEPVWDHKCCLERTTAANIENNEWKWLWLSMYSKLIAAKDGKETCHTQCYCGAFYSKIMEKRVQEKLHQEAWDDACFDYIILIIIRLFKIILRQNRTLISLKVFKLYWSKKHHSQSSWNHEWANPSGRCWNITKYHWIIELNNWFWPAWCDRWQVRGSQSHSNLLGTMDISARFHGNPLEKYNYFSTDQSAGLTDIQTDRQLSTFSEFHILGCDFKRMLRDLLLHHSMLYFSWPTCILLFATVAGSFILNIKRELFVTKRLF